MGKLHDLPVHAKAVIEALLTMKAEDEKNPGGVLGAAPGEVTDGEMGKVKKQAAPGGPMRGEDRGTPSTGVSQAQEMDVSVDMSGSSGGSTEEPDEFGKMLKQYRDMGLPGEQARLRALYRLQSER